MYMGKKVNIYIWWAKGPFLCCTTMTIVQYPAVGLTTAIMAANLSKYNYTTQEAQFPPLDNVTSSRKNVQPLSRYSACRGLERDIDRRNEWVTVQKNHMSTVAMIPITYTHMYLRRVIAVAIIRCQLNSL